MFEKIKRSVRNYFTKKKPFTIVTDILFIVLVILLIIPGTRKEVSSFFIRLTAFPPSTLDTDEQYTINEQTAQWELVDLSGNKVILSDLFDRPVLVNLWATWCPPCIAELPGLLDLQKEYGSKAHFLFVTDENPAVVKAFLKKHGYALTGFYLSKRVPADFATNSIPTSYILSKKGKVVLKKKGAARWNSGKIKRLLDKLNN